jgi:hypothetical protein
MVFPQGINFLHEAIWAGTHDDRLFSYALTQEFDPQSLNKDGGNLWHSLLYLLAPSPAEGRILTRAKLLNDLGIDPYQKNNAGKSAVEIITGEIATILSTLTKKDLLQNPLFSWKNENNKIERLLKILTYILESTTKTIK